MQEVSAATRPVHEFVHSDANIFYGRMTPEIAQNGL
jgi:hypothetical protein